MKKLVLRSESVLSQNIMKYFVLLNNKDSDSIVKQSFLMSKNLRSFNNSGFYSNLINMLDKIPFN